jgi:hypothetical protein
VKQRNLFPLQEMLHCTQKDIFFDEKTRLEKVITSSQKNETRRIPNSMNNICFLLKKYSEIFINAITKPQKTLLNIEKSF